MPRLLDDSARDRLLGAVGTARLTVAHADTADALGSGDLPVLATPRMVALMEEAACAAVADLLPPGVTTVGTHIDTRHTAPSPVGVEIEATARLIETEGDRLGFEVEAVQRGGPAPVPLGSGSHTRVAVERSAFLARLDPQR